ncbi:MAG: helix-turn-helix domain-containing protein [Egibacteraceae bacterium]
MEDESIGERIAYWRKRRGLTQQVLSGHIGRSVPWLSRIERSDRTVERMADLLALANVLKVDPGTLIGGIELPPNGGGPLDPPRGIIAVRRALMAVRLPDREPLTTAVLRAEVEQARRLRSNGRYEAVATVLPGLIGAARAAATRDTPDAWSCLAAVYHMASRLAKTVGEVTLAWIAADRALSAAQRSGDPLLVAKAARGLAMALMGLGLIDEAASVCSDGADAVAPTDATSLEGWSLWGSLHLTEAVSVARLDHSAQAWRLLGDARTAAERVGPGRNDYWESFGPANVGAHEVAVAMDSGDPVKALRLADRLEVAELPSPTRRARFCVDVACCQGLRRDDAAAVLQLCEAEGHAPELVRHSVQARELVRVCLRRERRSRTPWLRGLAERLGVA